MYVKFLPGELNSSSCPPHPANIYTYGVTTAPNMYGGNYYYFFYFLYVDEENITYMYLLTRTVCLQPRQCSSYLLLI